jgi:hypothetical protein
MNPPESTEVSSLFKALREEWFPVPCGTGFEDLSRQIVEKDGGKENGR